MLRTIHLPVVFAVTAALTPASASPREATTAQPATPAGYARIGKVFLPRPADDNTALAVDISPSVYALTHTVFEAEDWGDIPELGLSVQDMTPFPGGKWSGNKQIFWKPVVPAFKWDFNADGKAIVLYMTAAPDYDKLKIQLVCFRKAANGKVYNVAGLQNQNYLGAASYVSLKTVTFPLSQGCAHADMYRLNFGRGPYGRFGGIDRIVVVK